MGDCIEAHFLLYTFIYNNDYARVVVGEIMFNTVGILSILAASFLSGLISWINHITKFGICGVYINHLNYTWYEQWLIENVDSTYYISMKV